MVDGIQSHASNIFVKVLASLCTRVKSGSEGWLIHTARMYKNTE